MVLGRGIEEDGSEVVAMIEVGSEVDRWVGGWMAEAVIFKA